MAGKYYEEFTVGEVIVHQPSRTITQAENAIFCGITMNPQPLHLDETHAQRLGYPAPVVNGILTLGLMLGLSVGDTTLGTTLGNLGISDLSYPMPTFPGDTVTAETEILSKRPSASRSNAGIVEFEHRLRNQKGELILVCKRAGLMLLRGDGP